MVGSRATWRALGATLVVLAASVGVSESIAAQGIFFDAEINQAYTSADPLPSPFGYRVGVGGIALVGPLGAHVSFGEVSEDRGEIAESCNFVTCTPGPFDRTYVLRTFGFGMSYDFVNPTDVMLTLGLNGGANWTIERLRDVESGNRSTADKVGADLSFGASVDLRLRPTFAGARPSFSLRYDHIRGGTCAADATCFDARDALTIGIGLSWVFRARPR